MRKKLWLGGKWILRNLWNLILLRDEPKGEVIEAMKSNANQLTNLFKSPLTPDKERQLKEIIENNKQLNKIKPFWGESFLTWESMQKLLTFDINDEDMKKNGLVMKWSISSAMNILHSRTRLDANERMDKRVVGSSTNLFSKICLMR